MPCGGSFIHGSETVALSAPPLSAPQGAAAPLEAEVGLHCRSLVGPTATKLS